jgi:signal transduction histidine kinase/CheY-like chemotaxis protein/PAS domain-containing protein
MTVGGPSHGYRLNGDIRLVIVDSPDVAAPLVGALDVAGIGAWMWVEADNALYFSPRVLSLLGLALEPRANLLRRFIRAVHPEDQARVRRMFDREVPAGAYLERYRFTPPDGPLRWIEDRGRIERTPAGQLVRQGGVMRDVTEEVGSDHERREADARLEALVNAMPFAVWGYSGRSREELRVTHQNARSVAWRGDLIGRGFNDLPQELRNLWQSEIDDVLNGQVLRMRTSRELPGRVLDKIIAPVEVNGVSTGVVGVSIDVTEEERTRRFQYLLNEMTAEFASRSSDTLDAALHTALERLGRFFGGGMAAIGEVADDRRVRIPHWWVESAGGATAPAEEEFFDDQLNDLLDRVAANTPVTVRSLDDLAGQPALSAWCAGRRLQSFVLVPARHADDVLVVVGIGGAPDQPRDWPDDTVAQLRIAATVIAGVLARTRAEARQRLADKQIQEAKKLESLGVLAGGIAHDFNNLLTAILGNASLLRADYPDNAAIVAAVEQIESASKRAADLTRQMLAYAGRGRLALQPLDLNTLVRDCEPLLRATLPRRAALELRFTEPLPAVRGDQVQLRQLLTNLTLNAAEALDESDGRITIETAAEQLTADELAATVFNPRLPDGRYVRLSVVDTGSGMAPDIVARMFEPFFTTKFTGRGLGLSAVVGIVRAHQGALRVDSKPRRGSRFDLLLPVYSQAGHATAVDSRALRDEASPWRLEGTALVVDDESGVRDWVQSVMQRAGLTVLTADSGRAAIELFREMAQDLDVVLVDLTMPDVNGREVVAAMQQIDASVPTILMTGYTADASPETSAARVLLKPFNANALRAAVDQALGLT